MKKMIRSLIELRIFVSKFRVKLGGFFNRPVRHVGQKSTDIIVLLNCVYQITTKTKVN